jgi:hypothetical protein
VRDDEGQLGDLVGLASTSRWARTVPVAASKTDGGAPVLKLTGVSPGLGLGGTIVGLERR